MRVLLRRLIRVLRANGWRRSNTRAALVAMAMASVAIGTLAGVALVPDPTGGPDSESTSSRSDSNLLYNRFWFDQVPASQDHILHSYVFYDRGVGTYEYGSAWRGSFDHFQFRSVPEGLRVVFLADRTRHEMPFTIVRVEESVLDLRLTLPNDPRGDGIYYGSSQQHVGASAPQPFTRVMRPPVGVGLAEEP